MLPSSTRSLSRSRFLSSSSSSRRLASLPLASSRHFSSNRTLLANSSQKPTSSSSSPFHPTDPFLTRHLGYPFWVRQNDSTQTTPTSGSEEGGDYPSKEQDPIGYMLSQLNPPLPKGNKNQDPLESFLSTVIPDSIRLPSSKTINNSNTNGTVQGNDDGIDAIHPPMSERELLTRARKLGSLNKEMKSFIGGGYVRGETPSVVLRNMTENHAWFSSYTPYQPEISQGRLESLLNFQTMTTSLTSLSISNASLLDEATAAAEAMMMSFNHSNSNKNSPPRKTFLVDKGVYPQTIQVLKTRAQPFGINVLVGDVGEILGLNGDKKETVDLKDNEVAKSLMGVLVQYPSKDGSVPSYQSLSSSIHSLPTPSPLICCATDLLALTKLKPPGEWGADIAFGNSATFGVPLGYGGPHAAFFSCSKSLQRKIPGRLVGVSKDSQGGIAYRLALQTREQHIRREKATSNICTAQALLANMSAMFAVYHGPEGLKKMANRVEGICGVVKKVLENNIDGGKSFKVVNESFFDTLTVDCVGGSGKKVHEEAVKRGLNLGKVLSEDEGEGKVRITIDESTTLDEITRLINSFAAAAGGGAGGEQFSQEDIAQIGIEIGTSSSSAGGVGGIGGGIPEELKRTSEFMTHPVFNSYHSETEMLRYMHRLQSRDLSLVDAMIPLGSCTMKLNPTSAMLPMTWKPFSDVHPFAPLDQVEGYQIILKELEQDLSRLTGFPAVSLQPNSGANGEYAGLSVIRAYHHSRGDEKREVCLVPLSAHGTNPASAIMAGMKVVPVKTLPSGALDLDDLRTKAEKHSDTLAAFMVTYPSTFGVFEDGVKEACKIIHDNGGQVYLDGANMNAQMGLTNPAICGADVCHLNLHKTLAIPHGGGGPGQGPICVASHLAPFLPGHPIVPGVGGSQSIPPVSAAPFGSSSICLISWAFIKMLGGDGLRKSSIGALLNANYMMSRLKGHYPIKFQNEFGRCAHEFIVDFAELEKSSGLKVMDFAKRLQDYGFHPPTCSWPISTGMLIEPTESEPLSEIDRLCDALIQIHKEAEDIASGKQPKDNNVIKNAPHPISVIALSDDKWNRPYSREQAAFPDSRLRHKKAWPMTSRLDDAYGDVNLICECPSVEEVASDD